MDRSQLIENEKRPVSRRDVLRLGASALAATAFVGIGSHESGAAKGPGKGGGSATEKLGNGPTTPFKFVPFTQNLPIAPIKQPLSVGTPPAGFVPGEVFHGIAPEYFNIGFDRSAYELYPTKF